MPTSRTPPLNGSHMTCPSRESMIIKASLSAVSVLSVKKRLYRPEILSGYTQEDVDEPIEPEE